MIPLRSKPIELVGDINKIMIQEDDEETFHVTINIRVKYMKRKDIELSVYQWDNAKIRITPGMDRGVP